MLNSGMSIADPSFDAFFNKATNHDPYPFQTSLATCERFPELIDIPTGLGKTDAVVLAWLWRRRFSGQEVRAATPRRLVYCLPMRVLVEQTAKKAHMWLKNLGMHAEVAGDGLSLDSVKSSEKSGIEGKGITVTVLMGGEDKKQIGEWDLYPERDAILIGTQDMLLSRALNRGYGMSRYRWPTHFGLLNNECLWVLDEVQLMGKGLTTTAQLEAFRRQLGTSGNTKTIWMSATLEPEWLRTADFEPDMDSANIFALDAKDLAEKKIESRIKASKVLRQSDSKIDDLNRLADEILERHHSDKSGARTLVVLNTVRRAVELHAAMKKKGTQAKLILIHSRFRPQDRKNVVEAMLSKPGNEGMVIISTQVVEAGVDISSRLLYTELAPWSSLVQRFGRCNRSGEYDCAEVYWIDVPTGTNSKALPYQDEELDKARGLLLELNEKNVNSSSLPKVSLPFRHAQVIRQKDMIDLFDTTPDLTGHDIDVSRFIRETSDNDLQVFWRDLPKEGPGEQEPRPERKELCSVPLGDLRDLIKKSTDAWVWNALEGVWSRLGRSMPLLPGSLVMLRAADGRYTEETGWDPKSKSPVTVVPLIEKQPGDRYMDDGTSASDWGTIAEHTDDVISTMTKIADDLGLKDETRSILLEACRWHDSGKAHSAFQSMIKPDELREFPYPPAAKAPREAWRRGRLPNHFRESDGRRKYFRHELVSGILALQHAEPDLVAYLAAAHHGKVRLSIRSMPDEYLPPNGGRFARGVWEGDKVAEVDLGGGIRLPATTLDLSYMDLGYGQNGSSWLSRMLALRDSSDLGPFRLSYMEALMKAADERASGGKT
jgi:CRISPR-associated endonuclease/helicase Cas3